MFLRRHLCVLLAVWLAIGAPVTAVHAARLAPPRTASAPLGSETYIPIVPPDTIAGFVTETQTITNFLANLPIEAQLAHDVLERVLDAIAVHLGDTITQLLKAFGIDFNVDLGNFSFKWLLNLLHFYSYNEDAAVKLLELWNTGGMTPEQEEALRRLYLSQMAVQVGFQSSMQMADDAAEGLYDLVDLILGATRMVDKIGEGLAQVPGAGELIARIKNMIAQRIVFAFQNAVELATAPLKEPLRSRIRAVATALATTYVKWKDLELPAGFGGIAVELVTKVGFGVMGKSLCLMGPKIGVVSMTQGPASLGVLKAQGGELTGTWEDARRKVLDDGVDETEDGFTESVVKNTIRKSKLSKLERQIANVAGAVSQITQLLNIIDPSSITKIISIVAAVVAGGLQVHSIFNSIFYLYKVPKQLKTAINHAFHPDQSPPGDRAGDEFVYIAATKEVRISHQRRIREAHLAFVGALEEVAESSIDPDPQLLVVSLEKLDNASRQLGERVARLGIFQRKISTDPGAVVDPVYTAVLNHQLLVAQVAAACLPAALGQRDAKSKRALRNSLVELENATRDCVLVAQSILDVGMMEGGTPSLELEFPGSVRMKDMITVKATIVNNGSSTATGVELRLVLVDGFKPTSNGIIQVGTLAPGAEKTVSWTLIAQTQNVKKRSGLAVFATANEGVWASRFSHVSK